MICRVAIVGEDYEFNSVERSYYPADGNWSAERDGYGFWNGRIVGDHNEVCIPLSMEELLNQDKHLIVVGEGDCGKSVAMHDIANVAGRRGYVFSARLRSYRNSSILFDQISEAIRSAKAASKRCFVLLDGIDENEGIIDTLVEFVKRSQSNIVRFILSSRPRKKLKKLSEAVDVRMYKLAPFTLNDAAQIATALGVDWYDFFREAAKKLVLRMCAKPELCVQLLRLQKIGKLKAKSAKRLFLDIATDLCREHRDGMPEQSAFRTDDFSDSEVLDASAWIAVVFSLLKKSEISVATVEDGGDDIFVKELITDQYSEPLIRTALNGRLFEPMSSTSFRIGVEDMIPFLAGKWLAEHMSDDNIRTLLVDRTNPETGRLYAVLGWVESFIPGVSYELMRERPELILITAKSIETYDIGALYEALFRRYWDLPYQERKEQIVVRLSHLRNFGLEAIIQEELCKKDTRRLIFAAEVVKECVLHEVTPNIVNAILDVSIDGEAREFLSYAILRVVDEHHGDCVARLRPLLDLKIEGQLEENIWANVLRCMYPKFVGIDEALRLLKPPVAANYYGAYAVFTEYVLPQSLSTVINERNASVALDWSARHIFADKPIDRLGRLARQIFTFCWRYASRADVRNSIVKCVLSYLDNGKYSMPFISKEEQREGILEGFDKEEYFRQKDVRVKVFVDIVRSADPGRMSHQIASLAGSCRDLPLVTEDDFEEMAMILVANPGELNLMAEILRDLTSRLDLDKHAKTLRKLYVLFPGDEWFNVKAIRRRKAQAERQWQKWERQDIQRKENAQLAMFQYREWMHSSVRDLMFERFPSLVCTMGKADGNVEIPLLDIRESVGWSLLDEHEQENLRVMGSWFLQALNGDNDTDEIAVCCALKLSCSRIQDLGKTQLVEYGLVRLFRILVRNEHFWHDDEDVLKMVQELHARVAVCRAVLVDVLVEQCMHGLINPLYAFCMLLNSEEVEDIVSRLRAKPPSDLYFSRIIKALAQVGAAANRCLSDMFVWDALQPPQIGQANMLRVAVELSPQARMKSLLRWIERDAEWGKRWIEAALISHEEEGFVKYVLECQPAQIADFLVFLDRAYPDSLGHRHRNELSYSPDGVDNAYCLKTHLTNSLRNIESDIGIRVLRRVARIVGTRKWTRVVEEAKRSRRAFAEKKAEVGLPPITLDELKCFLLLKNKRKVLIYTSESLRRFLERALLKYDKWLHSGGGKNVVRLWRRVHKGRSYCWKHKNELSLSDEICMFIEKESVSLSAFREPFVSFYNKGGKKCRGFADLIVHAQDPNGIKAPAEVIIEVKGNWNREVKTSLRRQLVNRYLRNRGRSSHGIFTCGCYNLRNAVIGYRSKEEAKKNLETQRKSLSKMWRNRVGVAALDCSLDCAKGVKGLI